MDFEALEKIAKEHERKHGSSNKRYEEMMRKEKATQDKIMELVGKLQRSNDPRDFIVNTKNIRKSCAGKNEEKEEAEKDDGERAKKRKKLNDTWQPWILENIATTTRKRIMKDWLGDSPRKDEKSFIFHFGINRAQFRTIQSDIAARNHPFYTERGINDTCIEAKIMLPITVLRLGHESSDDMPVDYFGLSREKAKQACKEFDSIFRSIYGKPPTRLVSGVEWKEIISEIGAEKAASKLAKILQEEDRT